MAADCVIFLEENDLVIGGTSFQHIIYKVTWKSPDGRTGQRARHEPSLGHDKTFHSVMTGKARWPASLSPFISSGLQRPRTHKQNYASFMINKRRAGGSQELTSSWSCPPLPPPPPTHAEMTPPWQPKAEDPAQNGSLYIKCYDKIHTSHIMTWNSCLVSF